MPSSSLNAVCSELLSTDDLNIDDELFQRVIKDNIITKISEDIKQPSINIYATSQLYLSSIVPILHDFGFNIIDEIAYKLLKNKQDIYINRFNIKIEDNKNISKSKCNIEQVISDSLNGTIISRCQLFSLVYNENLSIRKIMLLRAFIEYIDQSVPELSSSTILQTITSYSKISKLFVEYFLAKFNPKLSKREKTLKDFEVSIEEKIKEVPNIMDDKILKLTYALIQNLLRTNYFLYSKAISFKIDTKTYSENLRGLQPNIEAFVYHPDFSGLHLRMSKISRGGLRWSERHEDYRQEIKSLMITQEGKNSIIIPDGAKGGFVIHKDKSEITKDIFKTIYSTFINNMLDLVDNMVDGEILRNEKIVAYDGDDAYFVVAADKGTASMSDVANSIAIERGYWLGDAFASGGSNGFGHKELGITARGALISTERFFIEKGIDIQRTPISIVGIGSMKGDVFGNGLLYSKQFKLIAAISHKEIFIDPDPDPLKSYEERLRLFTAKDGSWSAYKKELISKGGGVFFRSTKSIEPSPEIKKMIGSTKKAFSGEELAKKLLMMKVDMLFNGGVGTYVKSIDESNLDLGDKQNEAVRLDAHELQAKVVCEGGNLGFTQKARIEYARGGGEINIDGIDNAAGVNTSDHEVNLKILLNIIKSKNLLNEEDADKTLQNLTEQVVNLVLWNNYHQTLVISKDAKMSKTYLADFLSTIEVLENNLPSFSRKDFHIPKNENINEVLCPMGSIVRPVISSLVSYSKIFIKNILLESTLIDETFAIQYLFKYFPRTFVGAYEHEISHHPLRREIIATVIADVVINLQGTTFIANYEEKHQDKFLLKIKSYLITNELFGANDIRYEIFRNDLSMDIKQQYKLLSEIERTLSFSTRWMLKYLNKHQVDVNHILDYKESLFDILSKIHEFDFVKILPDNHKFNLFFSAIEYLRFAVAAIMVKETSSHSFDNVARLFYIVVNEFKILEMITSLDSIEISVENEKTLRYQILQYIEYIVVHYTEQVLTFQRVDESPQIAFENYLENQKESFTQIKNQIDTFMSKDAKDINEINIIVNQIMTSLI
ncbi:MAG: glutamate dehydrogenase [Sulfurimonas sp.]|jgi:glutamate dehydrogenase|uniref:NAD-glutamate dehydrogenase domain-containing protein n=1 Tax=Sulfurimonas sp. TaxID=2022749 RepID=UPI0039E2A97B